MQLKIWTFVVHFFHFSVLGSRMKAQLHWAIWTKEHWYRGEADSSTTKLYSDSSLKSVFGTKSITVEFGCSKVDGPKVFADLSADIVFAYTYMVKTLRIVQSKYDFSIQAVTFFSISFRSR